MTFEEATEKTKKIRDLRFQIEDLTKTRDAYLKNYSETCKALEAQIDALIAELKPFAEENLPEDKKSIPTVYGTMRFRAQLPKFFFDNGDEVNAYDKRLIDFVQKNAPEFVKVKRYADWSALKKELSADGNANLYLSDGQLLEGIHIQFLPDKFSVES